MSALANMTSQRDCWVVGAPGAGRRQHAGAVIQSFLDNVRPVVQASARGGGCAIAAVTVTGAVGKDQASLRDTAGAAFTGWIDELAAKLIQAGMGSPRATELASLMIVTLEGAHVLCRAAGSIAPSTTPRRRCWLASKTLSDRQRHDPVLVTRGKPSATATWLTEIRPIRPA
jgi:hypothetical protein